MNTFAEMSTIREYKINLGADNPLFYFIERDYNELLVISNLVMVNYSYKTSLFQMFLFRNPLVYLDMKRSWK